MKKFYIGIFNIGCIVSALAQTTALTQANHAYIIGNTFKTTDAGTVATSPGPSGPGVTWNFSSLAIGTMTTVNTATTVASTGSAAAYPSASVAVVGGSNNSFYSSTATDLLYWGGNFNIQGQNVTLGYTSPAAYAKYPMSYNTTTTSVVSGTVITAIGTGNFAGTCTNVADGTGTLQLPARTFTSNILRVMTKSVLNYTVSIVTGMLTLENYEYYNSALSKSPMFSILNSTLTASLGGGPWIQALLNVNTDYASVGVNETLKEISNLNLFPNPAKTNFNLSFVNENGENSSYEMINALGQTIRKENLGNEKGNLKHNINLEGIDSGIYFVKIYVGNSTLVKKITVQ